MSSLAAPSVRQRLRAVTDEIHQALHQAVPFAAIAESRLDRQGYGAVLAFLYRYHQSLAPACAEGADFLGAPELKTAHRSRLAALEDDLAFLEQNVPASATAACASGAFAAGCLYTAQGSTLGGKIIHRQLDYLLPDDRGREFFAGNESDGANWRALCAGLERHGATDALEAGALFAFTRFRDLLEAA